MKIEIRKLAEKMQHDAAIVLKNASEYGSKIRKLALTVVTTAHSTLTFQKISEVLGVHIDSISRHITSFHGHWLRDFVVNNLQGPKPILTKSEKREISEFVDACNPSEIGLKTVYWTSDIVAHVIAVIFEKRISNTTVRKILKEYGNSYHKGETRNIRRNDAAIKAWIDVLGPTLLELDMQDGYQPFFMDETGVRGEQLRRPTWGLIGQRITIPQGNSTSTNCIGAIAKNGASHFLTTLGSIDSFVVEKFIESLHKATGANIAIYCDNASYHKSPVIKELLARSPWLRIRYLPKYAPEYNPIELLWAWLKNNLMLRSTIETSKLLEEYVGVQLNILAAKLRKLPCIWEAKELSYIP